MSRCLREKTLLELRDGEGTEQERAHLEACSACTLRYEQLIDDLARIERVLLAPLPLVRARRPAHVWWLPTVAAVAGAVALVLVGVRTWGPAPAGLPRAPSGEALVFLDDVSDVLFSPDEAEAAPVAELPRALVEPCAAEDAVFDAECDDEFALPEEQ